jgi:hypothetical protein
LLEYHNFHTQKDPKTIISYSEGKHEEIVLKLVESNSKKIESSGEHNRKLSIPKEVMQEIEVYGLDSISILRAVIH